MKPIKLFVSVNQSTAAAPGPGVNLIRLIQPPTPMKAAEPGKPPTPLPGVNADSFKGGNGNIVFEINNASDELAAEFPVGTTFELLPTAAQVDAAEQAAK